MVELNASLTAHVESLSFFSACCGCGMGGKDKVVRSWRSYCQSPTEGGCAVSPSDRIRETPSCWRTEGRRTL